jgi:hypothetical protein
MPAFASFPNEGAIIGRLLTGYGEIEYLYAMCLASVVEDEDSALRALFILRGERSRLDVSHELMRAAYKKAGLSNKYDPTHTATKFCLTVRNAFSHCLWAHDLSAGLFYVDLEDTAERKTFDFRSAHEWRHVDLTLLSNIELYFINTSQPLKWVAAEYRVYSGKVRKNTFQWPKGIPQPKLHNPQEKHVPPWLIENGDENH